MPIGDQITVVLFMLCSSHCSQMGGFYCVSLPVSAFNSLHVLLITLLIYFHMVGGNRPDENKYINCGGDRWLTNCGLIIFAIKFFHNNLSEGEIGWELTFLFCITGGRSGAQSAAYLSFLILFSLFDCVMRAVRRTNSQQTVVNIVTLQQKT